jgi:SAM-dependent methyltransferase
MSDPTHRFSDRVADYVRFRPSYPAGVIDTLRSAGLLGSDKIVADLGAGTGIFTTLLLPHAARVFAVEPNAPMRAAAEATLGGDPRFVSVAGTAEATTLPDRSVDLVTAAQAFHWFDVPRARVELRRILRPGGAVALVWNERLTDTTPFLADYEALLRRRATDYATVNHANLRAQDLAPFFGPGGHVLERFDYRQDFDLAGLTGRLLSSSYAPATGQPGHEAMRRELGEIFARHQQDGRVAFVYQTKLYWGRLD